MYIVRWDGETPADKAEWIEILREVFVGATGTYRVRFYPGPHGWRFDLEWREDASEADLIANSPESVRYILYDALVRAGKTMDDDWRGGGRLDTPIERLP